MAKKSTIKKISKKAFVSTSNPFASQIQKLERIQEIKKQLNSMKTLHQEHDQLLKEVLPLFIETTPDSFSIRRRVTLGGKTFRLTPNFFDEKKAEHQSKVWKSTAFETFFIE